MLNVVEGQVLTVHELFVDDLDNPLELSNQSLGPRVRLLDHDKSIITEVIAAPDLTKEPGTWIASLPVPKLDLSKPTEYKVVWLFVDDEGTKHKARNWVVIEPEVERRKSDIVALETDLRFEVSVPVVFNQVTDQLSFNLYRNNEAQYASPISATDASVQIRPGVNNTSFSVPANGLAPAKLEPLLLLATYSRPGQDPQVFTYKVWSVTPQILVAASMVEDHINKARLDDIIPELQYVKGDIIAYLQRGLGMFNSLAPYISSFNGTNMQGPILDSWIICSCYYALAAQLQAEGAMAFDFSGQTTSLNIDRSPSIEAALGRLENLIENQVKPFKKLLAKSGVLSGSGAEGGSGISAARSIGILQITNSPTSRIGSYNGIYSRYRYR